jgi:hypothetical protein
MCGLSQRPLQASEYSPSGACTSNHVENLAGLWNLGKAMVYLDLHHNLV